MVQNCTGQGQIQYIGQGYIDSKNKTIFGYTSSFT